MISTAPQSSLSSPYDLDRSCSTTYHPSPLGQKASTAQPLNRVVKQFSSSQLFQEPVTVPPPLSEAEPIPLRRRPSEHHTIPRPLRRKPRHVPIVITQGLIASVLKGLPDSPELLEGDRVSHIQKVFNHLGDGGPLPQPRSWRPRHIPIVIPDFAQPYNPFPLPTPPSSGETTPHQNFSPISVDGSSDMNTSASAAGASRPGTADSTASNVNGAPAAPYAAQTADPTYYQRSFNRSQTSLNQDGNLEASIHADLGSRPVEQSQAAVNESQTSQPHAQQSQGVSGSTNLSSLMCNVHRCAGKEPRALVGATTTILGDKLYVFGGKRLSRRRPQLTADLYELDLVRRYWTKLETAGDVPPPRYFHSVCALGDNKLICYGGMSPAPTQSPSSQTSQTSTDQPTEVVVMSDLHIYDVPTRTWTHIQTKDNPQGRYAHCATVLPSSAVFSSASAALSAIHNNPSSANPNQGSIGVALDGTGGAEMVVVGGQDSANHYIEQISVFNLRSLKWTSTNSLGRSCGAYRSVVAPLTAMPASHLGVAAGTKEAKDEAGRSSGRVAGPSSMLIYSNYNFLDVKLELQVRHPDGSLVEKQMGGQSTPPGLRFPNGGVLDDHFVISGTFLTSSKQEYALWALDLRSLTWSRIDAGSSVFSQGSWNRGVLWPRRNTFVVLGNRRRNLIDDYNHRRINFSNICLVELEVFGYYDNPRHTDPTSGYSSFSAPHLPPALKPRLSAWTAAGRPHFKAATELGQAALGLRELADMDVLSITGEKIPVNSHILARRWGPYFVHLLREGSSAPSGNSGDSGGDGSTLRPATAGAASRNSSITITPSIQTAYTSSTLAPGGSTTNDSSTDNPTPFYPPNSTNLTPSARSRTLYLPHTPLTIQALLHYLYTSSLPPENHPLSTPQILCSLLQIARPYCVDGLLEAVVERLHQVMDGRNAPAVFNASAMAAGGGRGTGFKSFGGVQLSESDMNGDPEPMSVPGPNGVARRLGRSNSPELNGLGSVDTGAEDSEDDVSSIEGGTNADGLQDSSGYVEVGGPGAEEEVWNADRSCVVGLQKRGLRGLMEGRRIRERGKSVGVGGQSTFDT
ncbi:MAG: hypothetical protein LQ340_001435 [Diploschistes diacapsis]|nr:MAG: hypothetical protein LQ340_001435 [Diploschistes diacapsis]